METRQGYDVVVYLRKSFHGWTIYTEKGYQLSPEFRGNLATAKLAADAWISTWPSWTMVVEE